MIDLIIVLALEYWYLVIGLFGFAICYTFWTSIKTFIMWNFVKWDYPVKIAIYKKRGKGLIRQLDKAKKFKGKDGTEYYDTVKNGKIPRLDVNTMTADNTAMLYEFRPHEFKQIDLNTLSILEAKLKLEPMTESSKAFHMRNVQNSIRYKKQDMLSKYGAMVIIGLIFIGIIIVTATQIIQPMFNSMEKISKELNVMQNQNNRWWNTFNATLSEAGIKVNNKGMVDDSGIKPSVNASPVPY